MSFALIVVFAWPHILFLPIWFGKDAVRRVDIHARDVGGRLFGIEPPRRRKSKLCIKRCSGNKH